MLFDIEKADLVIRIATFVLQSEHRLEIDRQVSCPGLVCADGTQAPGERISVGMPPMQQDALAVHFRRAEPAADFALSCGGD